MEKPDSGEMPVKTSNLIDSAYGLTPARIAEIATDTGALGARVMSLAKALSFEAEPWGFGAELLLLANSNEA